MKQYILGIKLKNKLELYKNSLIADALSLEEAKELKKLNKKTKIYKLVEVKS